MSGVETQRGIRNHVFLFKELYDANDICEVIITTDSIDSVEVKHSDNGDLRISMRFKTEQQSWEEPEDLDIAKKQWVRYHEPSDGAYFPKKSCINCGHYAGSRGCAMSNHGPCTDWIATD